MDGICFLNTQRALLRDERLPEAPAIRAEARSDREIISQRESNSNRRDARPRASNSPVFPVFTRGYNTKFTLKSEIRAGYSHWQLLELRIP